MGPMDTPPPLVPRSVDLSSPEIQVQPFSLRMSKLGHVMQLALSDPLFSALYQQRYTLGDHDYARALRPDRRWSARKISVWVKGLLPVCQSDRFKSLYPAVAASPDALIIRAYGRPPDALDQSAIIDALAGGNGADDDTLVCMALLSSLEFVAQ
jgi:hypothetical protein